MSSINIDWHEEFRNNPDRWINHGRDILVNSCNHRNKKSGANTKAKYFDSCEECSISEDDCQPMMNYAYPLKIEPSEEDILKVVKNTCLTIMENQDTEEYFLVLCGGGMDLSQQVGLAYIYCQRWIPKDLIGEISKQKDLSVCSEEWKILRSAIIEQSETYINHLKNTKREWEEIK